jgi:hypothetical protein
MIHLLSESNPEPASEIAAEVPSTLQQFEGQGCIELM